MGITVALQTENGTQVAIVEDPTNILHRVLPDAEDSAFRLAGLIDWYGDTTFNALQAKLLRDEWGRIRDRVTDAGEAELLQRIDDLLRQAADGVHLYVKFIGD